MLNIRKNQKVVDYSIGEATEGHDITILLDGGFTCLGTLEWKCADGGSFQAVVSYDSASKQWEIMHGSLEVLHRSIKQFTEIKGLVT